MNDNDPQSLPEWLQREVDAHERTHARDRLLIGIAAMFLVVVVVLGANAWLKLLGYGA
jgi:hypothetical protein